MNDKVTHDFEIVKETIETGDFENAKVKMEAVLDMIQGSNEETDEEIYLCLNHITEFYVYSYYYSPDKEVKCTNVMYNEMYRTYGLILSSLGRYAEAEQAYSIAVQWNPVDLDSLLGLCEVYKLDGKLEEYLDVTRQAYRFCCTRATMARYYRNLGFYYVEKYKPEIARALYVYSNIYYKTDNADNELEYISSALQNPTPEYSLKELQQILRDNNIEPGPDATTIGIVYRVGQLLMSDGDKIRAKDCFTIVYDITQDEEVGGILSEL